MNSGTQEELCCTRETEENQKHLRTNQALSGKLEWTKKHRRGYRVTRCYQENQDLLRLTRAYHDLSGVIMPMMEHGHLLVPTNRIYTQDHQKAQWKHRFCNIINVLIGTPWVTHQHECNLENTGASRKSKAQVLSAPPGALQSTNNDLKQSRGDYTNIG